MKQEYDHLRNSFDLSVYFVVGPENTKNKDFREVIRDSISGGITFLQIRSKTASTRELMQLGRIAAEEIKNAGKQDKVALVINDRVDVAMSLRLKGLKIDGVHLGQDDLPADLARQMLGENAIIGISARSKDLFEYIKNFKTGDVDYFGAGPLRATDTKPDCGLVDGIIIERNLNEIKELKKISPLPIVIGGGVKLNDIADLKATGIDGFFVVSEIAGSDNPFASTQALVKSWRK